MIKLATIALTSMIAFAPMSWAKPKYGPDATPLSVKHDFFRSNPAPDFWSLIPFYLPQGNDRSCSLASVTMVVNGIRKSAALTSNDELATEADVLKRSKSPLWKKAVGKTGGGVTLDQLAEVTRAALTGYELKKWEVELMRFDDPDALAKLRKVLKENAKSADDFVIVNFLQSAATGDADVGHIAPLGAYDEKTDSVLVLDPDRQWYEPYWSPVPALLKGMTAADSSSKKSRGLILVRKSSN